MPLDPRRFTISRLMVGIALLGLNIGLVRGFLREEKFAGALLIAPTLQVAGWRYLRTRRRSWLGFVAGGSASVLALFACEHFPESAPSRWVRCYLDYAFHLFEIHFPRVLDSLILDHQDWFLVVAYFLPELAAAILGGLLFGVLSAFARGLPPTSARLHDGADPS